MTLSLHRPNPWEQGWGHGHLKDPQSPVREGEEFSSLEEEVGDRDHSGLLFVQPTPNNCPYSLEREREVILAGLTVAHQVAGLFAQPEQVLRIGSTDGPMVPAGDEGREGSISAGALLASPPLIGGEGRRQSPQLDANTHTWFSKGSAGSVHSPTGLPGSRLRGLAGLGFPRESRGGSRPFSSRPGDRQLFSDPSNWAVGNMPVTGVEGASGQSC